MESLKGLWILVVENDWDCAELFKFIFEDVGARVITVDSAGKALAIQNPYKPDILVSNLKLPDLDGYEFVKLVRAYEAQRGRHLVAVAVTSSKRRVNPARILGAGFQLHISNPINPDQLIADLASRVELKEAR